MNATAQQRMLLLAAGSRATIYETDSTTNLIIGALFYDYKGSLQLSTVYGCQRILATGSIMDQVAAG